MTTVDEGADRIEVAARYLPCDMDARLFSTADQLPVGLVVPGVEHHAIVQLEIRRFDGKLSAFYVSGGCHDIANAFSQTSGDRARVLQLSEADRYVKVFRDEIEEEIRDEKFDPDLRLRLQEPGEEAQESVLPQNDRHGYSQYARGRLLSQSQNPFRLLQEADRPPAQIEIFTSLPGQGHPSHRG